MKKWNRGTYSTQIGRIGKRGKQDAVNGDSRNKAAYIYIYIYIYMLSPTLNQTESREIQCFRHYLITVSLNITFLVIMTGSKLTPFS